MLEEFVTAWLLSALITLVISVTAIQVLGTIAIVAKWASFSIGLGWFRLFEYTGRSGNTIFALTFRGELVLLCLVGGLLYGLAATFMLP